MPAARLTSQHLAAVTARIPLLPARVVEDIYAAPGEREALDAVLERFPHFETALMLASPSLLHAVQTLRAGGKVKNKRAARKALSYAIRAATRATPFGLFASAGLVDTTAPGTLRIAEPTAPDVAISVSWLSAVYAEAEAHPLVRQKLLVAANDLHVRRGGMFFARHPDRIRRGIDPADPGAMSYEPIAVRANAAIETILEASRTPLTLERLQAVVASALSIEPQAACDLLDRLLQLGVLVFQRANGTDAMIALRDAYAADDTERADAIDAALTQVRELRTGHNAGDRASLERANAAFSSIHPSDAPLQLAAAHRCEGALPQRVLNDAARLAELLLGNTRRRRLDAYRERFSTRYEGTTRLVPLLELVDPDAGLGVPEDTSQIRPQADAELDALRLELVSRALAQQTIEVELSSDEARRLAKAPQRLPSHGFEAGFQVCAASAQAVDEGRYTVLPVYGITTDGTYKTTRRFAAAFGTDFEAAVRENQDAAISDEFTLPVELVFTARDTHYANLLQLPTAGYAVASVRDALPEGVARIDPADISIGIEGDRFYAYSRTLKRRLLIRETYMMQVPFFGPPHMRLLSLIGKQDHDMPRLFSWETLGRLPFAPRVRTGRLVLSPAKWTLSREELDRAKRDGLAAFMAAWRQRWNVPRWIYLCVRDLRLLLDLDSPLAIDVLSDQLTSSNDGYPVDPVVRFEEMYPSFDECWLERDGQQHCHEFIAAFHAVETQAAVALPATPHLSSRERFAPGGEWTYVKLYAPACEHETLLRTAIAPFVARRDEFGIDRWFFLRYADPRPHLRVRLHGGGEAFTKPFTAALRALLDAGTIESVSFDTYDPEYERYGGAAAMLHAERLFTQSSERVLDLILRGTPPTRAARMGVVLAVVGGVSALWFEYFDAATWNAAVEPLARSVATIPWESVRAAKAHLHSGSVTDGERDAVAELAALHAREQLLTQPHEVLQSLVHMTCNRIGIPPVAEGVVHATLWHAWHGAAREREAASLRLAGSATA